MKAAMVATCGPAYPGREKAAIKYSRDVDEFFEKKAADGMCTSPKWFVGPAGNTIWFIEGEYEALIGLLATPESQKYLMQGVFLWKDFEYGLYQVKREELRTDYEAALADLGLG